MSVAAKLASRAMSSSGSGTSGAAAVAPRPSSSVPPPLMFQKHPAVPTSNTPPVFEWATHGWYNLRLDALQAASTLTDVQADLLVKAFEARLVTLPCPECRAHYAQVWAETPFTLEHARSAAAAIAWVEELKAKVDAHVAANGAAATAADASVPPAAVKHARSQPPVPPPARTARITGLPRASTAAAKRFVPAAIAARRTPTVSAVRAAAAKMPLRPATTAHGDKLQRNVAVAAALQQTRANASGRRGCNCGRR